MHANDVRQVRGGERTTSKAKIKRTMWKSSTLLLKEKTNETTTKSKQNKKYK